MSAAPVLPSREAGAAVLEEQPVADPIAHALHEVRRVERRRRLRYATVVGSLGLALLAASLASLLLGRFEVTAAELARVVFTTEAMPERFVVLELRLPRLVLGILVGLAFGVAGALFQSVLRNPLASPDIIGISQGASVGAVGALLFAGWGGAAVSLSALVGAGVVGGLLYAVAWRGGMTGHRFVLAGIGVSYLCAAVVGYLLTRSDVRLVQGALVWMTGSLGQATWPTVGWLLLAVVVLLPLVALVARGLQLLLLGDDQAAGLGRRPERVRFVVIALGVALAAVGTAAAGPVLFVAFVAAPIARRMVGDGRLALVPAGLSGALLIVAADLVAQHVLPLDLAVPVGVVTGVVGGPYLIWLMATGRSRRA